MKVITLTQPYATLVALGAKRIETRSWSTSFRGPLAIHAAKGLGPVGGKTGLDLLCHEEPFLSALDDLGPAGTGRLPFGAIVAVCELVDCRRTDEVEAWAKGGWFKSMNDTTMRFWGLTDQERAFGDYGPSRFAWLLSDIRALPEPLPAKGALGLWEYQGELGV